MKTPKKIIVYISLLVFFISAFGGYHLYYSPLNQSKNSQSLNNSRSPANTGTSNLRMGGSCGSQGSWTQDALGQTHAIKDAVIALRDDPKCKGIEQVVENLNTVQDAFKAPTGGDNSNISNWEGLPSDIRALSQLTKSSSISKDVIPVLMGKTIENVTMAGNIMSLATRSQRTMKVGLDFLDQSLAILPQYDECMMGHPDQALALFGASLKMTSAFISSGETMVGRMGQTVSKLVTYLQQKKFSKVLMKLNQNDFWMSLSCIIETTTDTYCAAKDAYELLDYSLKEGELLKKIKSDQSMSNPLEGYYLLVREIPIVTQWIQKVQFGVTPRLTTDSTFKNDTLDSYNNFLKVQNRLLAIYSEELQLLSVAKTLESKKARVYTMLNKLKDIIVDGDSRIANDGGQNFFISSKVAGFIPFYLIGRDRIPKEVSNASGQFLISPEIYLENGGKYVSPEFDHPEALASKIGEKLQLLINESADNASALFQQRMVVDSRNLVDESVTSQTLSVFRSLENISSYLQKLITRSKKYKTNLIQLPSMIDTKKRIDDVIEAYAGVRKNVLGYLSMKQDSKSKEDLAELDELISKDTKLNEAYAKVIDTAYKSFNILFQRDTFLLTRMSTYVRKDYAQSVLEGSDMSSYQRDLLIVAGKNLIDRISSSQQINPADVKLDLSAAQVINKRNIDIIEELFADKLAGIILEVKAVADGESSDSWGLTQKSMQLFVKDLYKNMNMTRFLMYSWHTYPLNPELAYSLWKTYAHKDRYPTYFLDSARVPSEEDVYKSFEHFKSRLCIQALAFRNQDPFYELCEGSKLSPVLADETNIDQLSVSYDKRVASNQTSGGSSKVDRDVNICAYRDYRRSNYAYWLMKSFSNDVSAIKSE